jgi:hypothetical protein
MRGGSLPSGDNMSHDEFRGRDSSDPSLTPRMATPATTSGGMGKGICHIKDIVSRSGQHLHRGLVRWNYDSCQTGLTRRLTTDRPGFLRGGLRSFTWLMHSSA